MVCAKNKGSDQPVKVYQSLCCSQTTSTDSQNYRHKMKAQFTVWFETLLSTDTRALDKRGVLRIIQR